MLTPILYYINPLITSVALKKHKRYLGFFTFTSPKITINLQLIQTLFTFRSARRGQNRGKTTRRGGERAPDDAGTAMPQKKNSPPNGVPFRRRRASPGPIYNLYHSPSQAVPGKEARRVLMPSTPTPSGSRAARSASCGTRRCVKRPYSSFETVCKAAHLHKY